MRIDELDKALDSALAQYSSAEPLAGLEQRVLNRVRADGARPRFAFARWALALGVAVAMLTTAVLWQRPQPKLEGGLQPARRLSAALRERTLPHRQARRPVPLYRQAGRPVPPSIQARRPVSLSPNERALLALTERAPEALLDLQRQSTEPISIAEIKIEPLRSDDAKDDAK